MSNSMVLFGASLFRQLRSSLSSVDMSDVVWDSRKNDLLSGGESERGKEFRSVEEDGDDGEGMKLCLVVHRFSIDFKDFEEDERFVTPREILLPGLGVAGEFGGCLPENVTLTVSGLDDLRLEECFDIRLDEFLNERLLNLEIIEEGEGGHPNLMEGGVRERDGE